MSEKPDNISAAPSSTDGRAPAESLPVAGELVSAGPARDEHQWGRPRQVVAGTKPGGGALSRLHRAQLDVVARADAKLRRKAAKVVAASARAAELDDEGRPVTFAPEGFTPQEYNIAMDARKPMKQAPGYLAIMGRVFDSYARKDAAQEAAPQLNVAVKFYVNSEIKQYATVDLTEDEGE